MKTHHPQPVERGRNRTLPDVQPLSVIGSRPVRDLPLCVEPSVNPG